jgi:predicted MFS family arabinose efflux permease
MATLDGAKEEVGWLKVLFAVCAAVDASLLAWLAQQYSKADTLLVVLAIVTAGVLTAYAVWMNAVAYRRIRELENLA